MRDGHFVSGWGAEAVCTTTKLIAHKDEWVPFGLQFPAAGCGLCQPGGPGTPAKGAEVRDWGGGAVPQLVRGAATQGAVQRKVLPVREGGMALARRSASLPELASMDRTCINKRAVDLLGNAVLLREMRRRGSVDSAMMGKVL